MATFWDIGFLQYISPVLVFILVFAIIFAILQKSKFLGGNQKIDFLVAILASFIALISESTLKFIQITSAWYVLLIVAFFFIMVALYTSGTSSGDNIMDLGVPYQIIFYSAITILLVSLSHVFGPIFNPYSPEADPSWWALRILFHPKVFGVLLIFLIALVLINKVTKD